MSNEIKFVGLHAHSVFSVFDGLGYPQDHIDYAIENGMDALALTDHGNMNGLSYQILHSKKLQKEGKKFKPIFGIEGYFIDSIAKWKEEKAEIDKNKKGRKKKNCCTEVLKIIEGQQDLKTQISKLDFGQQVYVAAFLYSYVTLFEEHSIEFTPFNTYVPPLIIKDIQVLDEVFII